MTDLLTRDEYGAIAAEIDLPEAEPADSSEESDDDEEEEEEDEKESNAIVNRASFWVHCILLSLGAKMVMH